MNVTANEATLTGLKCLEHNNTFTNIRLSSDPDWVIVYRYKFNNPISIANLQPNTNYTWRVKFLWRIGK
ncbi:MAG: hypothetical protein IPO64_09550 [Bacteroidetes bacterium]|nr:hypothetical protein [Bacteroidota bacterium]